MRLDPAERETIKQAVAQLDPQARIYLFGSRVDDSARGGDIDLLIFSDKLGPMDKVSLYTEIFKHLEEQKLDLLIVKDGSDPFVQIVMKEAVPL